MKLRADTLPRGFNHCGLYPFTEEVILNLFKHTKKRKRKRMQTSQMINYKFIKTKPS